jgi:hypothetical protein
MEAINVDDGEDEDLKEVKDRENAWLLTAVGVCILILWAVLLSMKDSALFSILPVFLFCFVYVFAIGLLFFRRNLVIWEGFQSIHACTVIHLGRVPRPGGRISIHRGICKRLLHFPDQFNRSVGIVFIAFSVMVAKLVHIPLD